MPRWNPQIVVLDGVDYHTVVREQIKSAMVVRLPFRLRLGTFYRATFELDQHIEICCRNCEDVPKGLKWPANKKLTLTELERFNTDVMIISDYRTLRDAEIEQIRTSDDLEHLLIPGPVHQVEKALNRFIVAYSSIHEGWMQENLPQLVMGNEFLRRTQWDYTVLCPTGHSLTDDEVIELFERELEEEHRWPWVHFLHDLEPEKLQQIPRAFAQQEEHVFYEFAFLAMNRWIDDDSRVALLMAVVALEGAHGAFVKFVLTERLKGRVNKEAVLIENFLKEQGFYVLNELTPAILMEDDERPSVDIIAACSKAIQIRNAIMHAGTDKSGAYKMLKYTQKDISDSIRAVLDAYMCYVRALDKRKSVSEANTVG